MRLSFTFDEISSWLTRLCRTRVVVSSTADNVLTVAVPVNILLDLVSVKLRLEVIGLNPRMLMVRYKSAFGVDKLIGPALKWLRGRYPGIDGAVTFQPGNIIKVDFTKIPRMAPLLRNLELSRLYFTDRTLELDGQLIGGQ